MVRNPMSCCAVYPGEASWRKPLEGELSMRKRTAVSTGVTAAPGGVWVSFRTGMLGETILLSQQRLRMVKRPGVGKPGNLFGWVMFASTEFAGHSLYLAREDGIIGCLNPGTGFVRARGRVAGLAGTGQLLGAGPRGRALYGLAAAGVIAIAPSAAC